MGTYTSKISGVFNLVGATFTTAFFHQLHSGNDHPSVHRLAHVIDGQGRRGDGNQCLQLSSRPLPGLYAGFHGNGAFSFPGMKL